MEYRIATKEDMDNREFLQELFDEMYNVLPTPKAKR